MGMYDTFWGKYKCPACGETVKFEEQTKDLESLLEDFYPGDYCDRGNRDYWYTFENECENCHSVNVISLAIRRGQYLRPYLKTEADQIDIKSLDNIEDGYYRKHRYDEMCKKKLGWQEEDGEHIRKHVGDTIKVLRTLWTIEEVYTEELLATSNPRVKCFYEDNSIYRVTDGTDRRVIVVRNNRFLSRQMIWVCDDNLKQDDRTGEGTDTSYILQSNCKLVRVE